MTDGGHGMSSGKPIKKKFQLRSSILEQVCFLRQLSFASEMSAATATVPVHSKPPAILSLIGDTPLVEITRMDTGPCQLFVKLENQNPTGSIKDRVALAMIEAAERDGKLRPGGTIIEATAGNTGLGLALIAGAKGYRIILVIPDKMSQEKIAHVRALGAEVRMTRSDVTRGHPEYYQDVAFRLASQPGREPRSHRSPRSQQNGPALALEVDPDEQRHLPVVALAEPADTDGGQSSTSWNVPVAKRT